jgi:hypothetical protein
MKTFSEERILDFISTKGGRSIPKPNFGDRITIADWFSKEEPKVKIEKRKLTCHQKLVRAGYVRTYIECSLGIVVLNKIVVFRECNKIYRGVKSVYYGASEDKYSQLYYK